MYYLGWDFAYLVLEIIWVVFLAVVIFGIVHFTAVILPKFFRLTDINTFIDLFLWLFLVQELRLQTTLLPESGRELKSQLRTGCTACTHNRSYQSEIFSAPIWEIQCCVPSLRCFWRTTGVSVQLRLPDFSHIVTGILRPHDCHSGRWLRTDHADYGQKPNNSNWPPAYQFSDRDPYSPGLRRSFPCWWWHTQHWLSSLFLWDETIEIRQVPLPNQHRCFCSYAPIFSKCGCDKPLGLKLVGVSLLLRRPPFFMP